MQNREQNFKGFEPDTYRFLMELGFYNEKSFFDANRARCKRVVQPRLTATTPIFSSGMLFIVFSS